MRPQIWPTVEQSSTISTFQLWLGFVNFHHMYSYGLSVGCAFVANRTMIWISAKMGPVVPQKILLPSKCFPTDFTFVL